MASQVEENSVDPETFKNPELSCWLSSCTHLWKKHLQNEQTLTY